MVIGRLELEDVVGTAVEVVQRIRVGLRVLDQVAGTRAAQAAGGYRRGAGDGIEDLVGAVAADGVVGAVRVAGQQLRQQWRGGQRSQPQTLGQQLGGDLTTVFDVVVAIGRAGAVGEAQTTGRVAAQQRAADVGEVAGIAERVAEVDELAERAVGGCGAAGKDGQQQGGQRSCRRMHRVSPFLLLFCCALGRPFKLATAERRRQRTKGRFVGAGCRPKDGQRDRCTKTPRVLALAQ